MISKIIEIIKKKRIDQVALLFPDLDGNLRVKYVMPEEVLTGHHVSWENGISVDGSCIPSFKSLASTDWMLIRPDSSKPLLFDWTMDDPDGKTLGFICEIVNFTRDPRGMLMSAQEDAQRFGFIPYAGPKLCASIGKPDDIGDYTPIQNDNTLKFRQRIVRVLTRMGINIEYHYGKGSSGIDIDFVPKPVTTAADNIAIAKLAAIEVGKRMDLRVEFSGQPMYTHFSLWKDGQNAFFDPNDKHELSGVGKLFIEGILSKNKSISKFVNPYGYQNGLKTTWSFNRDDSVMQVPMYFIEKKKKDRIGWSKRCIYKNIYADSNQYLAFSSIVRAGMKRIARAEH